MVLFLDYESDRWRNLTAASTITAAAVMLYEFPIARNIAVMVGILVTNPGGIQGAARQWLEPGGEGVDFDGVREQVLKLRDTAREKGWWKGDADSAWAVFSSSIDDLAQEMLKAKNYHGGVSHGLVQTATASHVISLFISALAPLMMGIAIFNRATFLGAFEFGKKAAILAVLTGVAKILQNLLTKQLKVVAGLAMIVATVNGLWAMMAQMMEQKRPKPDFAVADITYVPPQDKSGLGTLKQKNNPFDMGGITPGTGGAYT